MSKFYNIHGDCRQLEFSVELASLGHSSSLSALNFDDFLRNRQRRGGHGLDAFASQKRIALERRTIRWQEAIPRPTILNVEIEEEEKEEELTGARGIGEGGGRDMKDEGEEEGKEEVEEDEGHKEEAEEEEVPEDPSQTLGGQKRTSAISHRIFTLLDSNSMSSFTHGQDEGGVHQLPPGQSPHFRQKRIAPMEQSSMKEPIRWDMSAEHKRKNRSAAFSQEKMRVMAYLGEEGASHYDPQDEHLLWELTLVNRQLLCIEPDNHLGQSIVHCRHGTFLSTITVNEELVQFDTLEEEKTKWEEEEAKEEEGDEPGVTFEVPEGNGEYWLHYMVEIAKARNFPSNGDVRVEWMLDVPAENFHLVQQGMESGRTQQCDTKAVGREDIAHFGHLLQFSLVYHPSQRNCPKATKIWPNILFRVTSEDGWSRFFVDGYCCLSLPTNPGTLQVALECWRPTDGGQSKMLALKNAHLGQALDFRQFWMAGPRDADNGNWSSIYSRGALSTESTGLLDLTIRSLHQSKYFISKDVFSSLRYSKMVQRAGLDGGLHWRIAKVLEEFERARSQLLALRARRAMQRVGRRGGK